MPNSFDYDYGIVSIVQLNLSVVKVDCLDHRPPSDVVKHVSKSSARKIKIFSKKNLCSKYLYMKSYPFVIVLRLVH